MAPPELPNDFQYPAWSFDPIQAARRLDDGNLLAWRAFATRGPDYESALLYDWIDAGSDSLRRGIYLARFIQEILNQIQVRGIGLNTVPPRSIGSRLCQHANKFVALGEITIDELWRPPMADKMFISQKLMPPASSLDWQLRCGAVKFTTDEQFFVTWKWQRKVRHPDFFRAHVVPISYQSAFVDNVEEL